MNIRTLKREQKKHVITKLGGKPSAVGRTRVRRKGRRAVIKEALEAAFALPGEGRPAEVDTGPGLDCLR